MNDVALIVRLPEKLREEFLSVCKEQDTTAAQELRKFMRAYVKKHNKENNK